MKHREPVFLVLLAAIVFSLYARTLKYDLIWDSKIYLEDNAAFFHQHDLADAFRIGHLVRQSSEDIKSTYYRPLVTASYMLEYRLWGLRNVTLRLVNIGLFFMALLVLYLFFRSLPATAAFAEIVVLLFAANPLNSDNIVWVVGRCDILMLLSVSAAFYFLSRSHGSRSRLFLCLSSFAFILGLLSKETTAFALPALLAFDWIRRGKPALSYHISNLLATSVFFVVKSGFLGIRTFELVFYDSLLENARVLLSAFGYYMRTIINPFSYVRFLEVSDLAGALLLFGVIGAAILAAIAWRALRDKILWIPLLLVTAFLAVHLALVFTKLIPFRLYSRYAMIPLLGLTWIGCHFLVRLKEKLRYSLVFVLLLAFIPAGILKSMDYRTEMTFFRAASEKAPANDYLQYQLAKTCYDAGEYLQADMALRKCLRLTMRKQNAVLVSLLSASLEFVRADYDKSLAWIDSLSGFERHYLEYVPFILFQVNHQKALIHFARGETEAAVALFEDNVSRYQNEPASYEELFKLYAGREMWSEARRIAEVYAGKFGDPDGHMDIDKVMADFRSGDPNFFYLNRNYDKASQLVHSAPLNLERAIQLAQIVFRSGRAHEGRRILDDYLNGNGSDYTTWNAAAGMYLVDLIRIEDAVRCFRRSLALNPQQPDIMILVDRLEREYLQNGL